MISIRDLSHFSFAQVCFQDIQNSHLLFPLIFIDRSLAENVVESHLYGSDIPEQYFFVVISYDSFLMIFKLSPLCTRVGDNSTFVCISWIVWQNFS